MVKKPRIKPKEPPLTELLLAGIGSELPDAEPEDDGNDNLFPQWEPIGTERVRLDRQDDLDRKWVYHGHLSYAEATEAFIVTHFGGGKYQAKLTSPDGTSGRWPIRATKYFTLPGQYKPPKSIQTPETPAKPEASASFVGMMAGSQNANPNEVLSTALVAQLLDVMKAAKEPRMSIDWGPIIVAGLGLVKEFSEARRPPPTDPAVTALAFQVEQIGVQLAKLNQPVAGPTTNAVTDAMSALKEVLGVQALIMGSRGEGREEDEDDKLLKFGGRVLEMIQTRVPIPGSPAEAPPAAAHSPSPTNNMAPWQLLVRQYGRQLIQSAQDGSPADGVAAAVFTLVPERFLPVLEQIVQQPNAASILINEIPPLAVHADWVQTLVGQLREEFRAVAESDDPEPEGTDDPTEPTK